MKNILSSKYMYIRAYPSGRAAWCAFGIRLLEHWDCGFESRSRRWYMSAFFFVVISCVGTGYAVGLSHSNDLCENV